MGDLDYRDLPVPAVADTPARVLEILEAGAAETNTTLIRAADDASAGRAITDIVRSTEAEWEHQDAVIAWDDPLLDRLKVKERVEATGAEFYRTPGRPSSPLTRQVRDVFREHVLRSKIGITTADYCIADTATLVLRSRPGQPAAVSLVPSVHIAVVPFGRVLPDFTGLYALLDRQLMSDPDALTHRMTLISGPSKTGDIELVMVQGAHGPRALYLVIVNDCI
jgi:L-lactate dehydrogenase complex protein LldG